MGSMHHAPGQNQWQVPPAEPEIIYFAYGSNLKFSQMANRCPSSVFIGRARLWNYRFQINERGFANVIEVDDEESFVDGLCYRLSALDEQALDRSEGVPAAYEKKMLEVEFWHAHLSLMGRTVSNVVQCQENEKRGERQQFGPPKSSFNPYRYHENTNHRVSRSGRNRKKRRSNSLPAQNRPPKGQTTFAMVYLSKIHIKNGRPWDEYIERMNSGLEEAMELGISSSYVQDAVRPHLEFGRGVREARTTSTFSRQGGRGKRRASRSSILFRRHG